MIYDTLVEPLPLAARTDVAAVRFSVTCGEVPQQNWTVISNPVDEGLDLSISAHFNGRNLGGKPIVLCVVWKFLYQLVGLNGTFSKETARRITCLYYFNC
jgi:hypothetical protein